MTNYLQRLQRGADRTVVHLQLARLLRSISQGIAIVDLALYLKELHWSATEIGGVLSAAGVAGAVLILFVGVLSDRYGRKRFLLVYESLTAISALLMVFTEYSPLLAIIIVLTGFGRGQNGAAGPFTPAEQAWMTAHVARQYRGRVFSTNNALGFFGMAIGSMLAALPRLWSHSLTGASAYKPLFGIMFVGSILCAIVIATAPKEHRPQRVEDTGSTKGGVATQQASDERSIRRQENRNMLRLGAVNVLNGLAVGFVGPMMSYWFAAKFGVSSAQIGVTLALSFVFTGISSLVTGALTTRFGLIRSVVLLQVLGTVMILILPLMPSFALASTFYVLRSALSRGTQGARSALSTSLTRDKRRGFSVSMNSLVMRMSSAIGPTFSGDLLNAGLFSVPFYITGVLQVCSALLYGRLFRRFDSPQRGN
ncbi:MFS transporter [Alicyclobacillus fastidiosus]|uniref:MFS transporter n=1 Tax=Alicyclobacillus fastidiosus TaxID=392011 RepID=A0ABV5ACR2_9BACL|nr:MFS transporter [Alicyclobacillus fastidiosus]WEH11452.1 MFS transporter [Alicyclobacillus fastidiosus]